MGSSARNVTCSVAVPSGRVDLEPARIAHQPPITMFPASPLDSAVQSSGTGKRIPFQLSRRVLLSAATIALATVLGAAGRWVHLQSISSEGFAAAAAASPGGISGVSVIFQLAAAALIGLLVTAVQREVQRDRPMNRSMEQAQTLLCVSGALMMIIIGNSLARAFGIAGAAAIIRFRTPVDDPRDATILFLLMGLGMSSGLGQFAVAGLGTAFLCVALLILDRMSSQKTRVMSVEIVAEGRLFPTTHVENVFARNQIVFEPREISQSDDVTVKYHTWLDPRTSLEDLSGQLMTIGGGVKSVAWEHPKRDRQ